MEKLTFDKLKDWAFLGLLTIATSILYEMKKSVETLNTQVATVIEKSVWHEKLLNRHENEIRALQHKER